MRTLDQDNPPDTVSSFIDKTRQDRSVRSDLDNLGFSFTQDKQNFISRVEGDVKESLGEQLDFVDDLICRFYEASKLDKDVCQELLQKLFLHLSILEEMSRTYGLEREVAKQQYDEEFWSAYRHPVEGTQNDRLAYAYTRTIEGFYLFLYKDYWLQCINSRLKQLKDLKNTVEMIFNKSWA